MLRSPGLPRSLLAGPYFRTSLGQLHLPGRALLASSLLHVALICFPFPNLPERRKADSAAREPDYQLTWYGSAHDLRPLVPPSPRDDRTDGPLPQRRADADHPRQTIISAPKLPNHPRQTLLQPNAPSIAPKVLPPLPNIVRWSEPALPQPPRPIFQVQGPRVEATPATAPRGELPIPAVPNQEKFLGPLRIGLNDAVPPRPQLALHAGSILAPSPQSGSREMGPAPEVAAQAGRNDGGLQQLIALSADPAPPAPVIEVPAGNLQARVLISPEGRQQGAPEGATDGAAGGPGGTSGSPAGNPGGATGPEGISISGGDSKHAVTVAGLSGVGTGRPLASPLPPKPEPRLVLAEPGRTRPAAGLDRIKPGAPPEAILGPRRVYTLHVNMPNLTSVTGSWVLRFAEMAGEEADSSRSPAPSDAGPEASDLAGPVPVRKVDPRYPPALADAKIQGEVILYAIIRRDGTVDSIQLLKGVEPRLDQNAMEALARWKFRPAARNGAAVELEAVIQIPFRAVAPQPF